MSEKSADTGTIEALLERLNKYRLPRALELKDKVDRGETLDDTDIAFLEEVFEDAGKTGPLLDRNPKYQMLAGRLVGLYREITDKALKNEKK